LTALRFGLLNGQQPPALAQQAQTIKRTPLQKLDVPGPESGYVLEGDFTLLVEGQPPLALKAGDSHKAPSGAIP
jgi:quercetin dioxygenase-like cupin family protein